jgi:hypothetical protein
MWHAFQNGETIGKAGSEGGQIVADEEHDDGARITLEKCDRPPAAITCGIYGFMLHTRYFSSVAEAQPEYEEMKLELGRILKNFADESVDAEQANHNLFAAVEQFVERFPT